MDKEKIKNENEFLKCEYVFAGDFLPDDNNGLVFGCQEVVDFPEYVEWFKTIRELETNTKKNKLIIKNRIKFLKRFTGKKNG